MTTTLNHVATKKGRTSPLCGSGPLSTVAGSLREWFASIVASVLSITLLVQPLAVSLPLVVLGLCQYQYCRMRLKFIVRHLPRKAVSAYVKLVRWIQELCGCASELAIVILGVLIILAAILMGTKPFVFGGVLGLVAVSVSPPVRSRLMRSFQKGQRPVINEDRLQRLITVAIKESDKIDSKVERNNRLVVPFIDVLGFNPFDASQVIAGFSLDESDVATELDYAVLAGDQILAIIETANPAMTYAEQSPAKLKRYLRESGARWGIWTDGKEYSIYESSTPPTGEDVRPTIQFSLLNLDVNKLGIVAKHLSSME